MTSSVRGLSMPLATYRRRRAGAVRLTTAAFAGPVPILLLGKGDEPALVRDGRQDPWFDYYTGCHEDDAALLIEPGTRQRDTLFLDPGDAKKIVWHGPRLGPGPEAKRLFAVHAVRPRAEREGRVQDALGRSGGRICLLWRTREPGLQAAAAARWRRKLAGATILNAEPALVHQRMIKDADEVQWHRVAISRTWAGLKAVLPRIPLLRHEAAIASELTCHYRSHDFAPLAFPPIVGAGSHGATLHYPHNDQPIARKAPLLIDSGATAGGYCADVTRCIPSHGRFDDKRYRSVYELVLSANALARQHARPGMTRDELAEIAWKPIIDAGFTRHHHLSHHIGQDVHDPAERQARLAPGMIISNEPGVYLPDEGFGIRIEDDLLITRDGCEELTRAIPKDIASLEALMRG